MSRVMLHGKYYQITIKSGTLGRKPGGAAIDLLLCKNRPQCFNTNKGELPPLCLLVFDWYWIAR